MWDFNKNPRNTYLKKELYYKYKMLRICLKTIKTFYIVKMQNAYSTLKKNKEYFEKKSFSLFVNLVLSPW